MALTFGIEFELNFPRTMTRSALEATLNEDLEGRWRVGTDGSIERMDGYDTAEVRSPVLQYTPNGLLRARQAADKLSALGCVVNASCGGHIHVGGWQTDNLFQDVRTIAHVAESVAHLEQAIWQYSGGEKRANSEYCRSVREQASRYDQTSITGWFNEVMSNKYRAVNFYTSTNKTIEFRLFAGTVSPEVLNVNIQIACEIVKQAMKGKSVVNDLENFKDFNKVFPMVDTTKLRKWLNSYRAAERNMARIAHTYHPLALELWRHIATSANENQRTALRTILPTVSNGFVTTETLHEYAGGRMYGQKHTYILQAKDGGVERGVRIIVYKRNDMDDATRHLPDAERPMRVYDLHIYWL